MKKNTCWLTALLLLLLLAACVRAEPTKPARVMTLNGSTGFGMAKLAADGRYEVSVETDASAVTAALVNGSTDIAALPTNAAAALYAKTGGGIRCIALNTRGVLWLVADASESGIRSLADLDGKTVFCPAQNPSFIFSALCEKAGVRVTVDNTYAQPADLRTALAAGQVSLAVLPEPMVTAACSANADLRTVLDLTDEWDQVFPAGSLVQGCAVVRREFADEHPEAVRQFLQDYEASVRYLIEEPTAAAALIAETGIFPSAETAEKALPRCGVCFVTGEEMREEVTAYLEILFGEAPASIGGSVPDADFCLLPESGGADS